ncbi:hypothetical protein BRS41_22310 [Salmonella enterica subsp. enterica serovar Agona]|uniref:Uncharacterized protein n=1 Tax=Salmonella enteritidis TaxID=149539 RepID=A0A634EZ17_SALEN|nr:hypothetical protein [Salmonella enterica subsp. enterica serovar Enteritidis]EDI4572164.1 hypothetical protein [Salmonella enterica subsp. enterica serovar Agona]EDL3348305.1 hypothetical protein [Salmonella enterica subsp. enterica serovar Typhimurium]EDM6396333.1 hypothetical protein [Salmonella enterica subsp. enterica serovar Enteritidis]EDN0720958.1 hypothetical protein [Salmonella enterica subsp. enterica serovar Typhimurium]
MTTSSFCPSFFIIASSFILTISPCANSFKSTPVTIAILIISLNLGSVLPDAILTSVLTLMPVFSASSS